MNNIPTAREVKNRIDNTLYNRAIDIVKDKLSDAVAENKYQCSADIEMQYDDALLDDLGKFFASLGYTTNVSSSGARHVTIGLDWSNPEEC